MNAKKNKKRCIVLLIDGLSSKKLQSFMRRGLVPNIKRLAQAGTYIKECISTFPSVTASAHISIFMGKNPAYFGITGHNQFYRNYRYFDNYTFNYSKLNQQLTGANSVYDYYENSVAVGELIHKGSNKFVRYLSNALLWGFRSDWDTTRALKRVMQEYINGRDLIAGWIPNSDSFQHICGSDKYLIKLIKKVDDFVGKLINVKTENTRLIICSDHGMEKVKKRYLLKRSFGKMGLKISRMKFNFDGGGYAQIHFRHPQKGTFFKRKISYKKFKDYLMKETNFEDMMKRMAKAETVEFLFAAKKNSTYIFSRVGVGKITKKGTRYLYEVLEGKDPLQYEKDSIAKKLVGKWVTKKECLDHSHHTEYPDAIYQCHGLLQLRNAGDLIITPSRNCTWNTIMAPQGMHGGVRREQTVAPLIISDKIISAKPYMRTEDVFNYIIRKN